MTAEETSRASLVKYVSMFTELVTILANNNGHVLQCIP